MLSGLLFMGSTEEQLGLLAYMEIDIMSYSNVLLSFGFIVFVFSFSLIYLWEHLTNWPNLPQQNGGYTEVESREPILDASSAFLDDDDDQFSNEQDAVELKETNRHTTASRSDFV